MINNGGFELSTGTEWEAQNWAITVSTTCKTVGFGATDEPVEVFNWAKFNTSLDNYIPVYFQNYFWEKFFWVLIFYEEWQVDWDINFVDNMEWGLFDDDFVSGGSFGIDKMEWSIFDDNFAGISVIFSGGFYFETFDIDWA